MGNTRALAATIVALTVVVFGRPGPALAQDAELYAVSDVESRALF